MLAEVFVYGELCCAFTHAYNVIYVRMCVLCSMYIEREWIAQCAVYMRCLLSHLYLCGTTAQYIVDLMHAPGALSGEQFSTCADMCCYNKYLYSVVSSVRVRLTHWLCCVYLFILCATINCASTTTTTHCCRISVFIFTHI